MRKTEKTKTAAKKTTRRIAFDLERAKAGDALVTRDGEAARFLMHVPDANPNSQVVVLVGGIALSFHTNGRWLSAASEADLFMKEPKAKPAKLSAKERRDAASATLASVRAEESDKKAMQAVADSPFCCNFNKDEAIQGARLATADNRHALLVKLTYGPDPDRELEALVFNSAAPQAGDKGKLQYYTLNGTHTGPKGSNPSLDLYILHDKAVVRKSELSAIQHPVIIEDEALYKWNGEHWRHWRKAKEADYTQYPKLIAG